MLIILITFSIIILIDAKELKKANKKLATYMIYGFLICCSLFVSIILNYNIMIPTPADIIEGFLHMIKVV